MHATKDRVDLGEGARPVRFLPYLQRQAMRSLVKIEIEKQLETGVSSQPLVSGIFCGACTKKGRFSRVSVDYCRVNTLSRADEYLVRRMDYYIDSMSEETVLVHSIVILGTKKFRSLELTVTWRHSPHTWVFTGIEENRFV